MNPIPVLGIPYLNRPDLLRRLVRSIDYPVTTLVIIDNSNGAQGPQLLDMLTHFTTKHVDTIEIISHPNAGVAASWNEIIKLFPAPWWMISNNDIEFSPGDLGKMAAMMESQPPGMAFGFAASWFAITARAVAVVGLFDENLYPAYLEDCDWHYRAQLVGIRTENVPDVHAVHGEPHQRGSCTVNSDPELQRKNARTHEGNFAYYQSKWGGVNGHEKYKTPFNSGFPVQYWTFDPERRRQQQW